MSVPKPKAKKSKRPFLPGLFEGMFMNKVFHFDKKVTLSKLTMMQKDRWSKFEHLIKHIESFETMDVVIVPLSFDHKQQLWWTDYASAYAERYEQISRDKANLIITIRVDDDGVAIKKYGVTGSFMYPSTHVKKRMRIRGHSLQNKPTKGQMMTVNVSGDPKVDWDLQKMIDDFYYKNKRWFKAWCDDNNTVETIEFDF